MKINVITQLVLFFALAILLNQTHFPALFYIAVILGLALFGMKNNLFYCSIKRLKWFFLAMMIVFAFNTPGEHVMLPVVNISPTYEGLLAGCTQALRLVVMLAALSIIMVCNTKQQLISGLYFLCSPLKYLGLEVERFAARLWLTLHYVQARQDDDQKNKNKTQEEKYRQQFFNYLKNMTHTLSNESAHDDMEISFMLPEFTLFDYASIALLAALLLGLLTKAIL